MKVNVDLLLEMRKAKAWSQDELATAAGLNLRTIQRIENEATASLQSMKALAAAYRVNVRDLEYQESQMINELLGKEVSIRTTYVGVLYTIEGQLMEIQAPWLKVMHKKKPVYINMNEIVAVSARSA